MLDTVLKKIEQLNRGTDPELVETWSQAFSRSGPNRHVAAIDEVKKRYGIKSSETVYRRLRDYEIGLEQVLANDETYSDNGLVQLVDCLADDMGTNQKLRFDISCAAAAEMTCRSGLVRTTGNGFS